MVLTMHVTKSPKRLYSLKYNSLKLITIKIILNHKYYYQIGKSSSTFVQFINISSIQF